MSKKTGDLLDQKIRSGREYRDMPSMEAEQRDAEGEEKRLTVRGYATTFNEPYLLYEGAAYRVYEQVDPHAFDDCDMADVIMQYDHAGRVFARTGNGTLAMRVDGHGLLIEADLSGTEIGRQLFEEIRGGYTTKMSFGFRVAEDRSEATVDRENNKTTLLRTITKISKLYDVSAVSLPANDGTEISARSYCEGVIAELEAERLRAEERSRKLKALILQLEVNQNAY